MNQYNSSFNSSISTFIDPTNQSLYYRMSSSSRNTFMRYSQIVYVTMLVILGVSGNILCATVFCTKSLRRLRSSSYLFTLALTDAFFILDLLPGMLHTAFFSNLYHKMNIICYIQTYISFVASFLHIWMVLVFTAERFWAVNFPLRHMSQCTPKLSRCIIFLLTMSAIICYIHPAFFVSEVDETGQCREKGGYDIYMKNLNMIDTIMTMFLPFILVSILNVLIIRKLFCSKTFRQHAFANGSRYRCQRTPNWKRKEDTTPVTNISSSLTPISTMTTGNSVLLHRSQRFIRPFRSTSTQRTFCLYRAFLNADLSSSNLNHNGHNHKNSSNEAQSIRSKFSLKTKTILQTKRNETSVQRHVLTELRLTKMLLAISFTCLSLNFPSYYLRLIFLYEHRNDGSTSLSSATTVTTAAPTTTTTTIVPNKLMSTERDFTPYRAVIFHSLSYLSYSINIIIYLLFGGNFRRALRRLISFKSSDKEKNFNIILHRKILCNHDKHYGNVTDYESGGVTSTSLNSSLRDYSKQLTTREHQSSSLQHAIHQKQFYIS